MMQDFYYEKTRHSVTEDWPNGVTLQEVADLLGVERVSYRVYYSRDNLTCRLFVFRGSITVAQMRSMLHLGFVLAKSGDTEDIPNQPVEEVEE
jgi:hypothetical protein